MKALGIFRELQNSPNRETDDALILKAVLEQLANLGVETKAVTPEELDEMSLDGFDAVLPMCESYARIKRLEGDAKDGGKLWINPPSSVLACYRTHMVPTMLGLGGMVFPDSELRRVEEGAKEAPRYEAPHGWWLKRGDVHNTCDRDVVRAESWAEVPRILEDFREREIVHYVVQPHIEGDLVKFYGTGPGHWFTWFYHDPVRAERLPFELDTLADLAAKGAGALDLQVFGGDAIISKDGKITLIDLNSWPSFALVRREAAVQISWHLQNRLRGAAAKSGRTA